MFLRDEAGNFADSASNIILKEYLGRSESRFVFTLL